MNRYERAGLILIRQQASRANQLVRFTADDVQQQLCCVLQWHRRSIIVVHDPMELNGSLDGSHDLALHDHTDLYRYEQIAIGGRENVIFNPGECAGMVGFNAVGVWMQERLPPS